MINNDSWVWADWPAPKNIYAGTSTRSGGYSQHTFSQLNLALHVGDSIDLVNKNRKKIINELSLKPEPVWLNQQHTARIISLDDAAINIDADGAVTSRLGKICTVLSADCAPVLICDRVEQKVAAIHAGWKGICQGIIENTLTKFPDPSSLLIWIGPHISRDCYEVGEDVYSAAITHVDALREAFEVKKNGRWSCDLGRMIKILFRNAGANAIYDCGLCTYRLRKLFYSHRRDGITGRTASMIWMK